MGGTPIAAILALFSLGATFLNVARDILWRGPVAAPEWVGWAVASGGALALLLALAMLLAMIGWAPKEMTRRVQALLAPSDTKPFPDMPLADVAARVCPHALRGFPSEKVPEVEYDRLGRLLTEVAPQFRTVR